MNFDTRPLLVPLDGSSNAETAIAPAAQLARKLGAPLRFFHAIDPDIFESGVDLESARATFASYVEDVVERDAAGIAHDVVIVSGNPSKAAIEASRSAQAVVLATHGRGGILKSVVGSVADKIVRGAVVPTLVIPLGSECHVGDGPILVALDGSETAEHGLALARDLADRIGAKVVLMRAYSIPPPVGVEFVAYPVDLTASMKEATELYLKEAAQPGEEMYAIMAPAVDGIEDVADRTGASLVVMTSSGKGLAARLTLGSVTDRAMHSVKLPLLVVPIND
jgi:nucleotide-binding universal stress UspA family protein